MSSLSSIDFAALSPLFIVLCGSLILLLLECFAEGVAKRIASVFTLITIAIAIGAAYYAPFSENALLTPWVKFDPLSRLFTIFFLLIGFGSTLLADSFFRRFEASRPEYYFLLLSALFGLILVGSAADFLTLFLGIETLSISLYILCGYMKSWTFSTESAIKYFLMGALAAAFLLYGIALVYGAVGTTRFDALLAGYQSIVDSPEEILFLTGIAMITLALAFEAAIVPFHVWAPDVYDGAPNPVTAFMAVGTKVGAFAAFVNVFMIALPKFNLYWNEGVTILIYMTLVYANFVALRQVQLRRFFAYSGIAHAGFLLIPVVVGTSEALNALLFYLVIYAFATLGSFAILAFLDKNKEGVMLKDLHGLFRRSPVLAGIFAICLLTLAGIPPTAGFLAKFYLFKVAFQAEYYGLVIVGLLTTVLSAYYYLRIIALMFSEAPEEGETVMHSWSANALGAFSVAAILVFSFHPTPLLNMLAAIGK